MNIKRLLLSVMLLCGMTTMMANGTTTVAPQKEICYRTNSANDAWNSGYPKQAAYCRPTMEVVAETPVMVLDGVGYDNLKSAIAAAPTIAAAGTSPSVITLNKSIELNERIDIASKNITIKAATDGIAISRAEGYKKLCFLTKDELATLTLDGVTLDGRGIEAEAAFIENSNGKTVLNNVTMSNCTATSTQGSTIANKTKGALTLNNVTMDNCRMTGDNASRGILFVGTNGVTLKGANLLTNCTTGIYIEGKYTINATEATHTTPIDIIIEDEKRAIGNIITGGKAQAFTLTSSAFYLSQQGDDTYLMPAPTAAYFAHPAMLHSQSEIESVKANIDKWPLNDAYTHLTTSKYAQNGYQNKTSKLADGYLKRLDSNNWGPSGTKGQYSDYNNYTAAMEDANAAYQLALRYTVSGDESFAAAAVNVLNAWTNKCKGLLRLGGYTNNIPDPNQYLALIQGYEFANAAELLRGSSSWSAADFNAFKEWMRGTYAEVALLFLENHHGNPGTMHYWLNWDLAAMTAVLATGILCDDATLTDYIINYFKNPSSAEVGAIGNAVPYVHQDTDSNQLLGQCQESGRDQGHSTLDVALMGALCQMAKNIGEDLFAYDNYRALAMVEYVAKYNLLKAESYGKDNTSDADFEYNNVPFTDYVGGKDGEYSHSQISSDSRGELRPCWELFYAYAKRNGVAAAYCEKWCQLMRTKTGYGDGGAGDYGTTSGGYDQLGYGSLMFAVPSSGTGIEASKATRTTDAPAYDLRGIRSEGKKGIVIRNGKKRIE
ncbi:MAG: alginate lyase family protein [Prevotella sp.]